MSYFDDLRKRVKEENASLKKTVLHIISVLDSDPDLKGLFTMNTFTGDIEYSRIPIFDCDIKERTKITDDDLVLLKGFLAKKYKYEPAVGLIREGIILAAAENKMHPVKDYLMSLKWDGKERLKDWLHKGCGVEKVEHYTDEIAKKFMVAAVKRVLEPGCKFDFMLILEGEQGLGKSTLVRILGGEWFAALSLLDSDKDTIDGMRGKWFVEIDEMVYLKKDDIERIKAFLTRQVDRVRLAYRRDTVDIPRQSVFIGTINPDDTGYLRDVTGARRFWPVTCHKIDLNWLAKNRDQLFAEAVELYKKGEKLYLHKNESIVAAVREQADRDFVDARIDIVRQYVNDKRRITDWISVLDILVECFKALPSRINRTDQITISHLMKKLGYKKTKRGRSQDGHFSTFYCINPEEIINSGFETKTEIDESISKINAEEREMKDLVTNAESIWGEEDAV